MGAVAAGTATPQSCLPPGAHPKPGTPSDTFPFLQGPLGTWSSLDVLWWLTDVPSMGMLTLWCYPVLLCRLCDSGVFSSLCSIPGNGIPARQGHPPQGPQVQECLLRQREGGDHRLWALQHLRGSPGGQVGGHGQTGVLPRALKLGTWGKIPKNPSPGAFLSPQPLQTGVQEASGCRGAALFEGSWF